MAPVADESALVARRHNLPPQGTSFVGRDRERAEFAQALVTDRLLTLTGIGGCGKTRLALALAVDLIDRYPDGVWFVALAPLTAPAELIPAVAAVLGLHQTQETAPLTGLLAFLQPRSLLLVLDNCEHLIEASADFAARALAAAPGLRLLVTSREPLQIGGEQQRRLAPLAVPDPDHLPDLAALAASPAVQLFVARARAVAPDFQLTPENAPTVALICAHLDGIPLALELAAARVRVLALAQILARLDDCIRLLTDGSRVGPTRQQTLRATFDWSYALLTDAECAAFRRLAVFAGGWSLEAAEAACAGADLDPADVLDLLTRLVDKSLVQVETGQHAAWYRLLEPVRQYGALRLAERGETPATRDRHAAFFTELAVRSATTLRGPAQLALLPLLDRDQGNLRAALRWAADQGEAERSLRLATALATYWEARGQLVEGGEWLQAALAAAGTALAPLRVPALTALARLTYLQGSYADAARLSTASLALARELDDAAGIAAALGELGMTQRLQRDLPNSLRHLTEALDRFRALGDRAGEAFALQNLGMTARVAGDTVRSAAFLQAAVAIQQELGDLRQLALVSTMIGLNAAQAGDAGAAFAHLAAALAAHHEMGDPWFTIFDLLGLAQVLMAQDRPGEVARLLGVAQALGERVGTPLSRVGDVTFAPLHAAIAAQQDEPAFAAAWAEGRALPPARLVPYVQALVRTAAPAAAPAAPLTAAPLTRREWEVARLLVQGCSDRQIADTLSISVATVGVHVHHILEKLALRSRHQVADWATAQGLLATAPPYPHPAPVPAPRSTETL